MITIKEFLFELWKEESDKNNINMEKFIEILKMNNYITDFAEFSNKRYYDVIFYD